ncbi:MAG: hypothetical protein DRQ88_01125 [Epsilonproteobacteria bacterium]|nr:MAG: hypothetical protein DRQ89_05190 [Campylobacterota bacterium]RLA67896.1 MAG: hypothetical protein DRQ88_01125 [Campylobacterota bacterium]
MKFDINALIEKIKEKIPFGQKEEEEVVEVQEEVSDEGEETKVEEIEEEDDEDAAAKKKKGLYIKILAGVVVAFLAIDEFTKDKKGPPPAPTKKVRAKKKKVKKAKKAPVKKVAKEKKVEKQVKKVAMPKVEPKPEVKLPTITKEPIKPIKREISSVPPIPPKEEPKQQDPKELAIDVTEIVEEIGTPTTEELKGPAEYVSPPDYTEVGRGLVYNCRGKHWACVDKNSYFACRDNLKWSKENTKAPECFTKDVYRNEKDCRVIQTHFVNTNEQIDFCK